MRWLAVVTVMCLILIPFSVTAIEQDNLVINGTFDENMEGWDVETSQNFSITSDAGVCNIDTTHTDWLYDVNNTLTNATTYNMTVYSGDPSEQSLTHYVTVDNTTTILNNTFDNYSYNNWNYNIPDSQMTPFLRTNFSETYNLSEKTSLGIESTKLHNVTDFDYDFSYEPNSIAIGNASTDFVWKNNQYECNFTGNRHSIRQWNISDKYIHHDSKHNYFGMNASLIVNKSGNQSSRELFAIGFGNTKNANVLYNNNVIYLIFIRINATHVRVNMNIRNDVGSAVGTVPIELEYSNLTNGVDIEVFNYATTRGARVKNSTTGYVLASFLSTPLSNFHINTIQISNWVISTDNNINVNFTDMSSWMGTFGLSTTGIITLNKTIQITNDSVRLNINTNRLHYHDIQAGLVKSSINIETIQGIEEISNESTTSTSGWFETNNTIIDISENITITNWNSFSMTEGATTYPAKGVYYDNISIEAVEYDSNSSYTSQVFDREYFSDWRTIEVYFNALDGDYPIPMFGISPFDTIFTVSVFTRVGDHFIIDGTWSSWDETSEMIYYENTDGLLVWDSVIDSKNGRFIQYKYEVELWKRGLESPVFISSAISSVPIDISTEWGSIEQSIIKPYTNYTLLNYKYKIEELNNTMNGRICVYINETLINQHNYTFIETEWQNIEIDLPEVYNNSGIYNINFTVITVFNSTNGTSTILLDNIEFLIETQSPTIIDVNVIDIRDCPDSNCSSALIGFNGTFTDYSRGSDYEYLGLDGIQNVTISVAHYTFDVTNIQYLGNGTFYFIHAWENTPSVLTTVYKNVSFVVLDTAGLSDVEQDIVKYPTIMDFLLSALITCLFVIIIMMIINKHLVTDTKGDYLPEMISGKKGK